MKKNMPTENDLILIYYEDNPLSFARIENILPDSKPDWYHVKLLLLQIPPQLVTWILRDVYIDGNEFTMNGKRMRLEKVVVPDVPESPESIGPQNETDGAGTAKVISLKDVKKK
jgi:hypothetical protein